MARLVGEPEFTMLFHQGIKENIHVAAVDDQAILLAVFDHRTTVGMVRLFAKEATAAIGAVLAEAKDGRRGPALSPRPWRTVRPRGCSRNAGRLVNSRDDVVIQTDGRDAFAPEERHSLLESARLCEMIVEANPADAGALETLKETYTKLGDRDKLMRVVSALAVLSGVRASVGVSASKVAEPGRRAREPVRRPAPSPGADTRAAHGALG